VCCRDATASSLVAKVPSEIFTHLHVVAIKRHSIMRNLLFGLSRAPLISKKIMSMLLNLLFSRLTFLDPGESGRSVYGLCLCESCR
jgi:hypothetical protein